MTDKTDSALLREHLNGRTEAFDLFYQRHARPLFSYLLSGVKNKLEAEELLQVIFVKIFKVARRIAGLDDIRAYLFQTARCVIADHYRRNPGKREKPLPKSICLMCAKAGPGNETANKELAQAMLFSLPDEQRETVALRIFSGLDFREIAQVMNTNINTAAYRYQSALKKLKERYHDRIK
ncbi:RNA polymerase sigma factor [Planctomycetota bacterium]